MDESPQPTVTGLHRLALDLAVGAARVVRERGGRPVDGARADTAGAGKGEDVGTKSSPTDLVTSTDRATERWLVEQLQRRRPGDAVLGEEGGDRVPVAPARVRWVLDPIDGTVNFVLGLPHYAVSVAAELDGRVVAGAVANPATSEVFHAWRGGGAWLAGLDALDGPSGRPSDRAPGDAAVGARLRGPRRVPLDRAVIATGFGYDATRRARQAAVVAALLGRVGDLRRLGAAALDLCFVAAGRVDGFFEAGLNVWDHAAGGLVATEAGCDVTGLRGRAASGELLVCAGPPLVDDLSAALADLGADRVTDLP